MWIKTTTYPIIKTFHPKETIIIPELTTWITDHIAETPDKLTTAFEEFLSQLGVLLRTNKDKLRGSVEPYERNSLHEIFHAFKFRVSKWIKQQTEKVWDGVRVNERLHEPAFGGEVEQVERR